MHWTIRRIKESNGCVSGRIFFKGIAFIAFLYGSSFCVSGRIIPPEQLYVLPAQDEAWKANKKFTPAK